MKILVVEDDPKTATFLQKGLGEHGFAVEVCHDGDDGLHAALTGGPALVVLDVVLPGRDGWSILAELRRAGQEVPVLFLTARDTVPDRVKGLELGADDYLLKPFAFSELLARVRTLLRRAPARRPEVLQVEDLVIEPDRRRVTRAGRTIELTAKEFLLLSLLAERRGEVLTRGLIAEQVWDMNFDGDSNVVDVHVRRLRAKVDGPFERKLIGTVRGVGYVLG